VDPVRVLIVDDQEPFRRACGAVIDALDDFTVVGVGATGEASVHLAEELSPDLVLMDVNLPGISGLEATRLVRALESAPVVVLVSRGAGPPLTGRLLAGVLSNPIPRGAGPTRPSVRTTHEQAAA